MKIVAADWLPYCLPFKSPWRSSQGVLSERRGRLLRLETDDGRVGWGDCAPLPEFGISETAATSLAEELAYLDLASQKAGLPLNSWLSGKAPAASAAVNANLGGIFSVNDELVAAALEIGFSVLKIKVGLGQWQDEIVRLQKLSNCLPLGAKFRLDANLAWSETEAEQFLVACSELPIEGMEEPLRHPDQKALARLQSLVPFPIAIDESIHLIDGDFFHRPPVRRLVLKPARFGGLLATMEIALRAQASEVECIVTSSLESNCGLLACAHVAAAIAPQGTHGLGTADWFSENTGENLELHAGRLLLPATAGLGFFLHPSLNSQTRLCSETEERT